MRYRPLGSTGINVSEIAFGAGPIAGLMTGTDGDRQRDVVWRAVEVGINWFDTAATYGNGQSEASLGEALRGADAIERVHVATKVRLPPEHLNDIEAAVRTSVEASLKRLGLPRVTLLQLHNSITAARGDEPTSLTPRDVLGPAGVLDAFRRLRDAGLVSHLGLTAIGQARPLHEVVSSGEFATIQVPFSLVNPSAGHAVPATFEEADDGQIIAECQRRRMGVFAIRVFAGGALLGQPPSPYTFQTKFFPLDLYRRDELRAERLRSILDGRGVSLREAALRFVLSHSGVTSAIVGIGDPSHIDDATASADAGPLDPDLITALLDVV
jgi:aryl-alcohol dehydrogenase-like predicted oxidoreductase